MQLYHYCSIPTALSILSNRSIRLSSLAHSNDSMEGRWTLLRIQELLTEKRLPNADISPTIEGLEYLLSRFDALGFCLSEKRDLLSQWRSYANDGSGFSIGFSDAFVAYWRNSRTCHQVLYKKKEQDALLRPFISRFIKIAKDGAWRAPASLRAQGLGARPPANIDEEQMSHAGAEFAKTGAELLGYLFLMKNPAFEEEIEWRLLTYVGEDVSHLEFHPNDKKLVPYTVWRFNDLPTHIQPITSITLGPKNETPIKTVERMLKRFCCSGTKPWTAGN